MTDVLNGIRPSADDVVAGEDGARVMPTWPAEDHVGWWERMRAAAPIRHAEVSASQGNLDADRLRFLIWTATGIACLAVAHRLQPDVGTLFAGPSSPISWLSLICGAVGLWLVPSLWLSALVARTGAGLAAWTGTRIATTLTWYALLGSMIHQIGEGAEVTTRGLLIVTIAATASVCLGVVLGMSPWPATPSLRVILAAGTGAVLAHAAIAVSMRVWTDDMNYSHLRRLEWLVLLGCAALVSIGTVGRIDMPSMRSARNIASTFVFLGVIAVASVVMRYAEGRWSPQQQMPSSFGMEQVAPSAGADAAFMLTPIGPEGSLLIARSQFSASDERGNALPIDSRLLGDDSVAGGGTLLVNLPRTARQLLCQNATATKLTVRETITGTRVQALMPPGWCGR